MSDCPKCDYPTKGEYKGIYDPGRRCPGCDFVDEDPFGHHRQPVNATVFHYGGTVDVRGGMFSGCVWLMNPTKGGGVHGSGEPLDHALLGFHQKKVKVTVIVEEVE